MNKPEHRTISVDVRKHCPALKSACSANTDLPGPDIQYTLQLDPDHESHEGATCPYAGEMDTDTSKGFPMLLLDDALIRETPNGRIRAVVECEGCRHLPHGFRTRELALKPRVLSGR